MREQIINLLMEIKFRVKKDTKVKKISCTQNIRVMKDTVQDKILVFLQKEITFVLPILTFILV
jgi:ABC-type antimicrobial peptide transport system ATPase subunit